MDCAEDDLEHVALIEHDFGEPDIQSVYSVPI